MTFIVSWHGIFGVIWPGRLTRSWADGRPNPATAGFEGERLTLDPGEWIVQIVRASYPTEDTPVHCLETICAASRNLFPIGQVAGHDEFWGSSHNLR